MEQTLKDAILEMVETVPNFTAVRKMFGIPLATFHVARRADPAWDASLKEAKAAGYDMMEDEAHRRAVMGWNEPVWYMGEEVGETRKYSDTLLKFLLTHCKPKKFNPGVKVSVGDGEKVSFVFNVGGPDSGK
jgi:hypothetical protein